MMLPRVPLLIQPMELQKPHLWLLSSGLGSPMYFQFFLCIHVLSILQCQLLSPPGEACRAKLEFTPLLLYIASARAGNIAHMCSVYYSPYSQVFPQSPANCGSAVNLIILSYINFLQFVFCHLNLLVSASYSNLSNLNYIKPFLSLHKSLFPAIYRKAHWVHFPVRLLFVWNDIY